MSSAVSMIGPKFYAWDSDTGKPLAFGKVYTYQAGTNTPKATYTSEDAVVANPNPVILNGAGYADIYLRGRYKIVVKDENDVEVWTSDPVSDGSSLLQPWIEETDAEQVAPDQFKVTGNKTDVFRYGRSVKLDDEVTFYATVLGSEYLSGETVVTIDAVDSLTSDLSRAWVSLVDLESLLPVLKGEAGETLVDAVTASLATFEPRMQQRFNEFIASSGYTGTGIDGAIEGYQAGIEITEHNQIIRDANGEFWRLSGSTEVPYTTIGTGLPEGGALVGLGDAVLRQQLDGDIANGLGARKVRGAVIYVATIADLHAMSTAGLDDGQRAYAAGIPFSWSLLDAKWVPSALAGANLHSIPLEAFGASPDASPDDNATAFSDMHSLLSDYQGIITCGPGEFKTNGTLRIPRSASFVGAGRESTVITADGSSGTFDDYAVVIKSGNTPTSMAGLGGDVSMGDTEVSFSAEHGLSVGDVFLIYNPNDYSFSGFREVYRNGEFCTVASVVSTATVEVERPLYASHQASVIEIYRCNEMATGGLKGFSAVAPGSQSGNNIVKGLVVEFAHQIELDKLGARGSDNASMTISKSYKVSGRGIDAHQWSQDPGFGTQYGLSIGNVQEADITGRFVGYRHGIVTGGGAEFSIPCRDIHVHDFVAKSRSGSIASADWHGNTEWSSYRNGVINGGGLNIAGNHNVISGITGGGPNMIVVYGREVLGCDHTVENVDVWTGTNDASRSLMDVGGNSSPINENTIEGGVFIFRGIRIFAPDAEGSHGISVRNRGASVEWGVMYEDVHVFAPKLLSTRGVVAISTVSGSSPKRVAAQNITGSDVFSHLLYLSSNDQDCLVKGIRFSGRHTFTTSTDTGTEYARKTLPYNMPKLGAAVHATISNRTTSGDRLIASGASAGDDAVDIHCVTIEGNFSASVERYVSWSISLDEF